MSDGMHRERSQEPTVFEIIAQMDALRKRAEAAERVIANVRNAVNRLKPHWPMQEIEKALETAGTGYLSPAEVKEQVRPLVECIDKLFHHETDHWAERELQVARDYAKTKGWV